MNVYPVTFNGNELHSVADVFIYDYNAVSLPSRDINIHKLARRSKSVITSSEYTDKTITVYMRVNSGSRADTENTTTMLKGLLQPQNGKLVVEQSGIEVSYTATMNEFNISWHGKSAYVQLGFIASTPIGTGVDINVLANMTATTQGESVTFLVGGSAITEPRINVVLNSVTGGSGGSINLYNALNNQGITISRNFTAGDILEVDSAEMVVLHNGAEVDFVGAFPVFGVGSQQLAYSDTFTTRNASISMTAPTMVV